MWQEVPTLWLGALWTVFKRSTVFKQRRLKRCALSVDNVAVLVAVLVDERLVILRHSAERHTHVREAAVVEEGLHGDLAGEVGEHHDAIVGTLVGRSVA